MNLDSASPYRPRANVGLLKPSKLPAVLFLEIGLPVLPDCAACMHYIHLPRDVRADQRTNVRPTTSRVGIDIRVCDRVYCLASG